MKKIIGKTIKILLSFLVVSLFGILILISIFKYYDNFISGCFDMILNILAFLMILLLIWKEKFRNQKMIALVILTILVRIGHGYYYGELSMKVEPLIHLQVKYGFEYRDMEIIETQKSTSDFLVPGNNRSARIKYNNNNTNITIYIDISKILL